MRYLILAAAVALSCAACSKSPPPPPAKTSDVMTEEDKTLYALGSVLGDRITSFDLTEAELEKVKAGFSDAVLHKKASFDASTYIPKIQQLQQTRVAAATEREKKASTEFLTKAAAEKGAQKLPSGLIFTVLTEGTGPSPKASDVVKVHYHGTLIDGTVFDSSVERNEPATFPLGNVIPCWTEGVQLMKVGGKSRLICPSDIAYGDGGRPPRIKPGATLIFDVELLGIEKQQQ
ncbi:MAG TPA: FKBP-type peptidyl-prolyl cis-trans isomerase [Povalibacter sp.]|nr:FKBP-type peptidyl-prolyl cis-trans isomerase [Povalibacter sp.]